MLWSRRNIAVKTVQRASAPRYIVSQFSIVDLSADPLVGWAGPASYSRTAWPCARYIKSGLQLPCCGLNDCLKHCEIIPCTSLILKDKDAIGVVKLAYTHSTPVYRCRSAATSCRNTFDPSPWDITIFEMWYQVSCEYSSQKEEQEKRMNRDQ